MDIPFGRVFRISTRGERELVSEYDGWPNGLKLHKDGRFFIADYKRGLIVLDPRTGKVEPLLETAYSEGFKGLAAGSSGSGPTARSTSWPPTCRARTASR